MASEQHGSADISTSPENTGIQKEETREQRKEKDKETEDMKQRDPDEEHWEVHHPNLSSIIKVTPQAWMSLSTRKDWEAEKWRKLHYTDSESLEGAKHINVTMDRQLQATTRLLEKQRRTMERQHTSLQRKLFTDSIKQKIKQEKSPARSPTRSPKLHRRKSQSHDNLYYTSHQEEVLFDLETSLRPRHDQPRSLTADCRRRELCTPLRERAHTMDNMYLNTQTHPPRSNSKEHLPDITKKKTFVSKWSSMTDVRDSCSKDKWLNDLMNHLPPDLYAHAQASQRMRKEYRLKRMLSRSHEECRNLGLEDSRFVNLTAVLVKQ